MSIGKTMMLCGVATLACVIVTESASAQCGMASWYHSNRKSHGGSDGFTAAHRTFPFGTRVRVKHQRSGREVIVHINDRGPFIRGRIIDLSQPASKALGIGGVGQVCISVVTDKDESPSAPATTATTRGWTPEVVPLPEKAPALPPQKNG
jgi:rare lipoprotein A